MQEYCPHCGASLKSYWHRLSPILIYALIKFKKGVLTKGENKIHLIKDLQDENKLKPYEWKNWTKLRFHGLVAKYKIKDKWERGYWLLTKRGNDFLNGRIEIPNKVRTFRNKIIERGYNIVNIKDVIDSVPFNETIDSLEYDVVELDQFNGAMFNLSDFNKHD